MPFYPPPWVEPGFSMLPDPIAHLDFWPVIACPNPRVGGPCNDTAMYLAGCPRCPVGVGRWFPICAYCMIEHRFSDQRIKCPTCGYEGLWRDVMEYRFLGVKA